MNVPNILSTWVSKLNEYIVATSFLVNSENAGAILVFPKPVGPIRQTGISQIGHAYIMIYRFFKLSEPLK